jgi:hypothetical protein
MSSMVLIVGVFSFKYFHYFPHLDRNFLNDFEVTKVGKGILFRFARSSRHLCARVLKKRFFLVLVIAT